MRFSDIKVILAGEYNEILISNREITKLCPHCSKETIQIYLTHHIYSEKDGSNWDGNFENILYPACYYLFACKLCDQVLLYHYYFDDGAEADDTTGIMNSWGEPTVGKYFPLTAKITEELQPLWPQNNFSEPQINNPEPQNTTPDLHEYVPNEIRKHYIELQKKRFSPELFAIELRKALELIWNDKNVEQTDADNKSISLLKRIKILCKREQIPYIKDIALKIKFTGDDAAHLNPPIDPKLIPLLDNFFVTLVNHLYVLPMQVMEWGIAFPNERR